MVKHLLYAFFLMALFLFSCIPQTAVSDQSGETSPEGVPKKTFQTKPSAKAVASSAKPKTELLEAAVLKQIFQSTYFGRKALAPFYRSLNQLTCCQKPVNILHIGDSHTVGDKFSGRLRQLFQDRFGSGGRGMLPVGKPYHYFQPSNVSISQTKGWEISNSLYKPDNSLYGLSGFRIQSANPNDAITLTMTDGTDFNSIGIEFQRHPNTGTIVVEIGELRGRDRSNPWEIATAAPSQTVGYYTIPVEGGGHQVKISPKGDGPIELLSWTFKRKQSGIIYHSHGIVGATINVINHWNRNVVSSEIGLLDPSLIIVAFGTNEGFHDDLETGEYARDFQARLALLRNAAPQAAIVVVGPPDAARLPSFCEKRISLRCSRLMPNEIEHYLELLADKDERLCRWHPPPKLEAVRKIQREVAVQNSYFFWDWSKVMGGACGIHTWAAEQNPPLSYQDHVHLTERGYHISAEALFKEIMRPYLKDSVINY